MNEPFAESVLIDIRDSSRVRVDPGIASEESHETGPASLGRLSPTPRLQECCTLQTMPRSESKPGRFSGWAIAPTSWRAASPRELRVGVERDDVVHASKE